MRSELHVSRVLLAALVAVGTGGCLGQKTPAGPERSPNEAYGLLFGANQGLSSLRAVVEARVGYAGRRISLPGVLLLDGLAGFRLDLLDPLDKPVAMIYSEGGRIIQYRPGTGVAASLGVLPSECRGVVPEDWVAAVLASSAVPPPGEVVTVRPLWGDRLLERSRDGAVRESVRYREAEAGPQPRLYTWYCGQDAVLEMKVRGWGQSGDRRMPAAAEIRYVKAGLEVAVELREVESNPALPPASLRPQLAEGTRWTVWRLP